MRPRYRRLLAAYRIPSVPYVLGTFQNWFVETRTNQSFWSHPGGRGHWGELTLQNLVEAAGLREHVDFDGSAELEGPPPTAVSVRPAREPRSADAF